METEDVIQEIQTIFILKEQEQLQTWKGHELMEAVTDPLLGSWTDEYGWENADKCSFKFPYPYITLTNGARFKVQAEWSNNAYFAGTGFPDGNGNYACIPGN